LQHDTTPKDVRKEFFDRDKETEIEMASFRAGEGLSGNK